MSNARPYLLAAAAVLACPGSAGAATVRVVDHFDPRSNTTSHEVVFAGTPGERNELNVRFDGNRTFRLSDRVSITPGSRCARQGPAQSTLVRCTIPRGESSGLTVNLGDGNDEAFVEGTGASLSGGAGNDLLHAADFANRFAGGTGNDTMTGGTRSDFFDEGPAASGADTINGNNGVDEVSYARRRHKVRADLHGDRDDGELGELDKIGDDVEDLTGGKAGDRLTGNLADNAIRGGGGSDIIKGRAGDDRLAARFDLFGLTRERTHDRLNGGSGIDTVGGSGGPNQLSGGPGPDVIFAGGGDDRISARDRRVDQISCGPGHDRARLDGYDFFAGGCERAKRTFKPAAVPLDLFGTGLRGGTAFITVGCPGDAPPRCKGTAKLKLRGRTLGRNAFSVPRGRKREAAIGLPAEIVGELRRGGVLVNVLTRSRDARGRTRTINRTLALPAF